MSIACGKKSKFLKATSIGCIFLIIKQHATNKNAPFWVET